MNQTAIDLPTFNALKDSLGEDFISELSQTYVEETHQLLMSLQQALTNQDYDAFQRAAHSIKSSSNSFGALQFGLLARDLEMMGKEKNMEGAQSKVELLTSQFDQVQLALEVLNHGE